MIIQPFRQASLNESETRNVRIKCFNQARSINPATFRRKNDLKVLNTDIKTNLSGCKPCNRGRVHI